MNEFIKEEKIHIITNYRRLRRSRLQKLIKERGLQRLGLRKAEMVEILQEDDRISQLYYTEWQIENYHCTSNNVGRYYDFQL